MQSTSMMAEDLFNLFNFELFEIGIGLLHEMGSPSSKVDCGVVLFPEKIEVLVTYQVY
jgi:hypothetical protein